MARSVNEILNQMLVEKSNNVALNQLSSGSVTAIWRLILYVVAYSINVLEQLFDLYSADVNSKIDTLEPHRPKWYRNKMLNFLENTTLIADSDVFDTTGLTDEQIEERRVIKHAVATEDSASSNLIIKIAGEKDGVRQSLTEEQEIQVVSYIKEIKDAGVRFLLINSEPDLFNAVIDVYYDAMKFVSEVDAACRDGVFSYIQNLPFNGEFSNMAMVDILQQIKGVRLIGQVQSSYAESGTNAFISITSKVIPKAGYMKINQLTINLVPYE